MRASPIGRITLSWQRLKLVEHREQVHLALGELGEVGHRRLELVRRGPGARPGAAARSSGGSTGTRPRASRASRGRPGSSRAPTRAWAGTPRSASRASGSPPRAPAAAARTVALRFVLSSRERAHRDVEVGDEVLEAALVGVESAAKTFCWAPTSFDRSCALAAEQGLVHHRSAAQRIRGVLERVVQRLAGGLALRGRSWSASSPGSGSPFSAPPKPTRSFWRSLRVSVLSVPSTWSICTGAEVCVAGRSSPLSSSGASGVPGLDVEEEVALEEDARADLDAGVAVDRQRLVLELHRHRDRGRVAAHRLDLRDLADVHAGDPHGLALRDRRRRSAALGAACPPTAETWLRQTSSPAARIPRKYHGS